MNNLAPVLSLPIDAHLGEIVSTLKQHRRLVLSAEAGAGKTTRVPPALLDHIEGQILVSEPRRLAARMAARRVAQERGGKVGDEIGYQVRFENKTSKATRIVYLTEGVLVRRLTGDPQLKGVGAVVLDEIHERNLPGDIALALLGRVNQGRSKPLPLIAMSATLDGAALAKHLDAPELQVRGRTFPVEIEFAKGRDDRRLEAQVSSAVRRSIREHGDGDVLVFLPGAGEIHRCADALEGPCRQAGVRLSKLHGELAGNEQDAIVRPDAPRQVVLSTNIAESSVTLPNIVCVVDSGLRRVPKRSPWTGLTTLETTRISQASAIQRAGRAGRVRAGHCIRLYDKGDFQRRPQHDAPAIADADLADLVLLLAKLGIAPNALPWLDAPPAATLGQAQALLRHLGAIEDGALTERGDAMLAFPLHPRLARLCLEAKERGAGNRGALLASLLAERELRRSSRFGGDGRNVAVGTSDLIERLEDIEGAEAEGLRRGDLLRRDLDPGAFSAIRNTHKRLCRILKVPSAPQRSLNDEEHDLLQSTLLAFPDRVGRREGNRVVFAQGAGELAEGTVVRDSPFVVALDVRQGRRSLSIEKASAVSADDLFELFEDAIDMEEHHRFDSDTEQVEAVSSIAYRGLVIEESIERNIAGPEVAEALALAAEKAGLERFFDATELEQFRRRVAFGAAHGLELQPIDDAALHAGLRDLCIGRRSFRDLQGASLIDALAGRLEPGAFAQLNAFAPAFVSLPGRSKVPVHYEVDRNPWIESRMQDFFGLKQGPQVARGRIPVVIHLQAPNYRAQQVTTDLAGFWENHYPSLRKELGRRYPAHYWPEDPKNAEPRKPQRRRKKR